MPTVVISEKPYGTYLDGGKPVILTPDDILTLKLLRDDQRKYWHNGNGRRRDVELEQLLETLERILKQVQ
jgi:hypothetical protein